MGLFDAWGPPTRMIRPFVPDKEETELAGFIRRCYSNEMREVHKASFEFIWMQAIAFLEGHHHFSWGYDKEGRYVASPVEDTNPTSHTENLIFPIVLRSLAMLTGSSPRATIAPQSMTRDDRQKARMGERFWRARAQMSEWDDDVDLAALITLATGNCFVKTTWDPGAGRYQSEKKLHEGDVSRRILTPFAMFFSPFATTLERSSYAVESSWHTLDYVQERWERGKYVVASTSKDRSSFWERRLLALNSLGGPMVTFEHNDRDPMVQVIEFWHRACERFPRGLHVVMANDIVLNPGNTDNPYVGWSDDNSLEIPYVHLQFARRIGGLWAMGQVEHAVPINRAINEVKTNTRRHIRLLAKQKWLTAQGGFVTEPTDQEGEIVEYDLQNTGGTPPQLVAPADLPAYIDRFMLGMDDSLKRVTAQSDVTQARADGSLATGVAVSLLQDQDAAVMTPIRNRFYRALGRVARNEMVIAQHQYDAKRTMRFLDTRGQWDVFAMKGTDFSGATDVVFLSEQSLGDSREAKFQKGLDLMKAGYWRLDSEVERAEVGEMMAPGAMHGIFRAISVAKEEAEDENYQMLVAADAGMPVELEAFDWQNHAMHRDVHNELRQTSEYRDADGPTKAIIDGHIAQHDQFLALEEQKQQMAMAMARGMPGEKGQASQPKPSPAEGDGQSAMQAGGQAGGVA